ncbi:tRNA1Val (adenine37-N6)-methyltransferase [Mycoplasma testudineum]|uniref:tRNA1Val (Adenine37-N6)-methyltransferase n=1 Tax=Mycoplasma testudineum TaxID=244584 RepID=A0A4R6IDY5_9MOLU|nr:tRNA1(Val) (adenine(37)-N6)-methyltransferase [Mycoplasma testudineum]OYD26697.1 lactate dehydrogenase [Mycoplasma testudineum]TDO19827.1 tRNA1Val (adenine37-N6)-methyltransferase [Mycoplasma testudineum]
MKNHLLLNNKNIELNNLGFDSNLKIYQHKQMFNYSVDTILFGNFIFLNHKIKNALEIGANNGALSIFIADRNIDLKIDAVEIQEQAVELAKINVSLNKKDNQINVIHRDFNQFVIDKKNKQIQKYDLIFVNPPYYQIDKTNYNDENLSKLIATHEVSLNLEQIVKGSRSLIKTKGYLDFVIPIERFVDLVCILRENNFEPKRIQFIYPRINDKPKFVLIESRFQAGYGQHYLNNLYLHPEDKNNHDYLEEIKKWYTPWKINNE